MRRTRTKAIVTIGALFVIGSLTSYTICQDAPRQRGARGGGANARQGFDPAAMRQRMNERMKEMLGADEEEWTVIEPRLNKVQELSMQVRGGGRGFGGRRGPGMFGRGGGRGGGGAVAPTAPAPRAGAEDAAQTPIAKARQALETELGKPNPDAGKIKAGLSEYRKERQKVKQELISAQEKLREILTVKQEAQLVLMGTLE